MRSSPALRSLVLALCTALAGTVQARPAPAPAATPPQHWAAWEQHERMAKESLFAHLPWRDIGPIVQGGRVVDIASVPNAPYTFYVAYATGGVWKKIGRAHV